MTATDRECLRRTVYAEAQGEGKLGQRAVAHVILNRSKNRKKTICQVVKEKGQFKRKAAPSSFVVPELGNDPTNGATSFRNTYERGWNNLKLYRKIGNHYFYGK